MWENNKISELINRLPIEWSKEFVKEEISWEVKESWERVSELLSNLNWDDKNSKLN
jgi:DNA-directed RNA polymerase specialized sigma subunit